MKPYDLINVYYDNVLYIFILVNINVRYEKIKKKKSTPQHFNLHID